LSKVLIFGDQDALFTNRPVNDDLIVSARRNFRDRRDVVTGGAKSPNYGKVAALIG